MNMKRYLRLASSLVALAGSVILHSCGAQYVVYAQTRTTDDAKMQMHDALRDIIDIKQAIELIKSHNAEADKRLDRDDRMIAVVAATGSVVFGLVSLLNLLGFAISPKTQPTPPHAESA